MRGSDPDAAVYYLAAMLEGGEDARFIARRMVILASEDVGNADPQALVVAVAAAQAVEHVGLPEAQLNLAQAAIYLALAPKSNAVHRRARRGAQGRPRARQRPAAEGAARRALPGREEARPRPGLRLSARRPGRLRGRPPAGRAEGPEVLPAVRTIALLTLALALVGTASAAVPAPPVGQLYHGVYPGGISGEEDDITPAESSPRTRRRCARRRLGCTSLDNWYRSRAFPLSSVIGFSWWNEQWENDNKPAHDTDMRVQDNPRPRRCVPGARRDAKANVLGRVGP